MRKHWNTTSFDWQYEAALAIERTRQRSEAHRKSTNDFRRRCSIVAAVLCVAVAAVVWLAQLPWWVFVGVAALIWIGAFAEWSK